MKEGTAVERFLRFLITVAGNAVTVVTHEKMHLDEIAAVWLLQKFGTPEFLLEFVPNGEIELGVGGGIFDEHPRNGTPEPDKEDQCCFSLLARAMGLSDEPALEKLLRYATHVDTKGDVHPFALGSLIQAQQESGAPEQEILAWGAAALEAIWSRQKAFCDAEIGSVGIVEVPTSFGAKPIKFAAFYTDNKALSRRLRHEYSDSPLVMVPRDGNGHTCVIPIGCHSNFIRDLVRMVRIKEAELTATEVSANWGLLESHGAIDSSPWYLQEGTDVLVNKPQGGLSTPLLPEDFKQIVRIAADATQLHPECKAGCEGGKCRNRDCPWYNLGLFRCRNIRNNMKKAKAQKA